MNKVCKKDLRDMPLVNAGLKYLDIRVCSDLNTVGLTGACSTEGGELHPFGFRNNILNIGVIVRELFGVIGWGQKTEINLSEIKDWPVRLVFDKEGFDGSVVGIGHFLEDRFVLFNDLFSAGLPSKMVCIKQAAGQTPIPPETPSHP